MSAVIVVISIGQARPWVHLTLPWINLYCLRFNYDLMVCRTPLIARLRVEQFDRPQNYGRCQKLGIGFLFDRYERVIQFDDTCMISPRTPDLTKLVPEDAIGCYLEGPSKGENFQQYLKIHRRAYGRVTELPRDRFYNSGVAVYSRFHAALFDLNSIPWPALQQDRYFPTQGYLSHQAQALQIPVLDLGPSFNLLGSQIKQHARPEDASSVFIFHLTSALTAEERLLWAQRLDAYFRTLVSSGRD